MLGILRRWRERRRAERGWAAQVWEQLKTTDTVVVQRVSTGLTIRAPFRPSRAEIADIVELIAEEGLEHPRNLDAAIDALAFAFGVNPNTEMSE